MPRPKTNSLVTLKLPIKTVCAICEDLTTCVFGDPELPSQPNGQTVCRSCYPYVALADYALMHYMPSIERPIGGSTPRL